MTAEIIKTDKAPAAVGTYSQGVKVGDTYLFSGQIGIDPTSGKLVEGVGPQIDQVLKNIDGLLDHCGLTRKNIMKTSIFLQDLGDFDLVNKAYIEYFTEPYPARSCVQVAALPKSALVEIEVIASTDVLP